MMQSGAEVYRVEDTLVRLLTKAGAEEVQAIATPTGLYLSLSIDGQIHTAVRRIGKSDIDLTRVCELNSFSRSLSAGVLPETALQELETVLARPPEYSWAQQALFALLAGGAFAYIFGGGPLESLGGSLGALLVFTGSLLLGRRKLNRFIIDYAGGAMAALSSLLLGLVLSFNADLAIIGAIMTLVPGLLLTNAIRDALTGNLLSGTSRLMEAIFVSVAIAGGVGTVLSLWRSLGGIL
jgi:uncharacterized membrane protein YjjP (DUF1212 family)